MILDIHNKKDVEKYCQTAINDWQCNEQAVNIYMGKLIEHITRVQEAGKYLGLDEARGIVHDQSKFTRWEFIPYCHTFTGSSKHPYFDNAWLHHLHNNDHHWQHWIIPEGRVLTMQPIAVVEMVADWFGAEKAYQGKWNMDSWLSDNLPKLEITSATKRMLNKIFTSTGFRELNESD